MKDKTTIDKWSFWIPERHLDEYKKDFEIAFKSARKEGKSYQEGWNDCLDANGLDGVNFEE